MGKSPLICMSMAADITVTIIIVPGPNPHRFLADEPRSLR
jgi:hypothetical protein